MPSVPFRKSNPSHIVQNDATIVTARPERPALPAADVVDGPVVRRLEDRLRWLLTTRGAQRSRRMRCVYVPAAAHAPHRGATMPSSVRSLQLFIALFSGYGPYGELINAVIIVQTNV